MEYRASGEPQGVAPQLKRKSLERRVHVGVNSIRIPRNDPVASVLSEPPSYDEENRP